MVNSKKACTLLLRLLAFSGTLSAAIVMATNHQTVTLFSIPVYAKYHYAPEFVFFVVTNAIGSLYGLIIIFLPPSISLQRIFIALDLIVTALLIAGASSATTIAYVGKKGNSHSGWLPICDNFHRFCDHVLGALISSFSAILIYMLLLLLSIYSSHN